jgi:hypothetical protein
MKKKNRRGNVEFGYTTFARKEWTVESHSLFPDLIEDDVKVFQYFRMTHEKLTVVLHLLKPDISKENTSFREAAAPKERL